MRTGSCSISARSCGPAPSASGEARTSRRPTSRRSRTSSATRPRVARSCGSRPPRACASRSAHPWSRPSWGPAGTSPAWATCRIDEQRTGRPHASSTTGRSAATADATSSGDRSSCAATRSGSSMCRAASPHANASVADFQRAFLGRAALRGPDGVRGPGPAALRGRGGAPLRDQVAVGHSADRVGAPGPCQERVEGRAVGQPGQVAHGRDRERAARVGRAQRPRPAVAPSRVNAR